MVNANTTQVHFCTCGYKAFMFGFTRKCGSSTEASLSDRESEFSHPDPTGVGPLGFRISGVSTGAKPEGASWAKSFVPGNQLLFSCSFVSNSF